MSADPRLRARMRAAATPKTPPPPPPPPPPRHDPTPVRNGTTAEDDESPGSNGVASQDSFKLKFCTVCASNNNRSMEGHLRLAAAHYPVVSFGTGSLVRLPGPSIQQPNVYNFNDASYEQMHANLEERDSKLYRANGILNMLERNREVKRGPERWQDWHIGQPRQSQASDQGSRGSEGGMVDIVITCEERCWDAVMDDLFNRGSPLDRPVHVFNIDIKDSHEEALVGGKAIVELADSLNEAAIMERDTLGTEGWEEGTGDGKNGFDAKVPYILADWQERWPQFPSIWTLAWF